MTVDWSQVWLDYDAELHRALDSGEFVDVERWQRIVQECVERQTPDQTELFTETKKDE